MTSKDNRPEQTAGKETAQGVGGLGSGAGGQGLGKRGMNMGRGLNPGGSALVKKSHLWEPWDRAARRPIRLSRRKSPLAPLWQRGEVNWKSPPFGKGGLGGFGRAPRSYPGGCEPSCHWVPGGFFGRLSVVSGQPSAVRRP